LKGIGEIVAVIAITFITIGMIIVASLIMTNITRQSEPKGAVLNIHGVRGIPLTPDYSQILVEAVVSVHGTDAIRYHNSSVFDPNGNRLTCSSPNTGSILNPGQIITITMTCTGKDEQWIYKQIVVEIFYINIGLNNTQVARAYGVILPYS